MAYSSGFQGHAFTVRYNGQVILQPQARSVPNTFDYMGMLIGLPRLPGEKNAEYRQRLLDVYARRAGAHEDGLINGITRELGLEQLNLITIQTATGNSHRVIVGDTMLTLMAVESDYYYNQSFSLVSRSDGYYFIGDLVDAINETGYFTATLLTGVDAFTPSMSLLKHDTNVTIDPPEELFSSKRHKLEHTNIINGTVRFSDIGTDIFYIEKTSESGLAAYGDYYIDYDNGVIVTYSKIPPGIECRYSYSDFPATLKASPVVLFDFGSPTFKDEIFEQILQSDGQYTEGLPKSEAVDYINELLSARGLLWGE